MNLSKKKLLVARTLNVGKDRVVFNVERLADIKEALTKQDVKDLVADGAIKIRDVRGRKTLVKSKSRRRAGSIRMKIKPGKAEYVRSIRKLRFYLVQLLKQGKINKDLYRKLRTEIRARTLKDKQHIKERISQ